MYELVTVEQLIQQIKEIEGEGVDVEIVIHETYPNRLVRPYNYEKLPDNATVDDLEFRVLECVKPFIYYIKL